MFLIFISILIGGTMKKIFTKTVLTGATAIVVYLMVMNFVLHMAVNSKYGLFFDEYYYYSMSSHLSFGYLDAPPITGWLMALSRLLLGDSIPAMHVFPALSGSFAMLFAAFTARRMGGGRLSQVLTALAIMLAPVFMTFSGMFTYDTFDQLMSAILIFQTAKILKGAATHRTWVLLGFIAGIGLMVKITMGFLLVCLVIGMLLTHARKYLASKWFFISIAIAAACFVPFVVWQAVNGFPIFEYLLAYKAARTASPTAIDLLQYVFVVMNPANVLLWLGGLVMLFTKRGRVFRPFAWAFLAYFTLSAVFSVRFYALAGVLLPLVAFGSVCFENNFRNAPLHLSQAGNTEPQASPKKKRKLSWTLKVCYIVVLCLLGAALTPVSIPLLSPEDTADYNEAIGYSEHVGWDTIIFTGIPTFFAGRLGWNELAKSIADVYHSLPEEDQKDCTIYCSLYGAVGAIDYYGKQYSLPPAISASLGAYYWGYNGYDGKCAICVNMGDDIYLTLKNFFEDVQTYPGSDAVPYSTLSLVDRTIYVCRGLKMPASEFWQLLRSAT